MSQEIPFSFQGFIARNGAYLEFSDRTDEGLDLLEEAETEEDRLLVRTINQVVKALSIPSRSELIALGAKNWKIVVEIFANNKTEYFDQHNYGRASEPHEVIKLDSIERLREAVVINLAEPLSHALRAHVEVEPEDSVSGTYNVGTNPKVYLGGKVVTTEGMDPSNRPGSTRPQEIERAIRTGRPLIYDRLNRPRIFEEGAILIPLKDKIFFPFPSEYMENPEYLDIKRN